MNRRATTYLKRSTQRPLTLVVRITESTAASFSTTIWGLLLSHSDRWKRAVLEIKNQSMINGLVRRIEKMPILESLAMYLFLDWKQQITFKNARYLTELNLNGVPPAGGIRSTSSEPFYFSFEMSRSYASSYSSLILIPTFPARACLYAFPVSNDLKPHLPSPGYFPASKHPCCNIFGCVTVITILMIDMKFDIPCPSFFLSYSSLDTFGITVFPRHLSSRSLRHTLPCQSLTYLS